LISAYRTDPEIVATPAFDPRAPSRMQANRVVRPIARWRLRATRRSVERYNEAIAQPVGIPIPRYDQIRSLLFHGARFLGWFGAIRQGRFRTRDARVLAQFVPMARARLVCQSRAAAAAVAPSAFDALLRKTSDLVVRIDEKNRIVDMSPAAHELFRADKLIADDIFETALTTQRTIVPTTNHQRLVFLGGDAVRSLELRRRASTWKLTQRELEVARALVQGWSNKEIAIAIRCAPRTAELHVNRILAKAGCETRARFVAKILTRE